MNTDSLRQLLALAESGSFSEAASRMGVTQPAISLTLKKIEGDLGVKFFERSGNRYLPTEVGRVFLECAREVLDAEARLLSSVEQARARRAGKLRLAASNIPGEYILPLVLGDFRMREKGIEPVLDVMDSSAVIASLSVGGHELGVIGTSTVPAGLEIIPFCPDTLLVACHPRHPLAARRHVRPQRLAEEKFLLREEGSGTREAMLAALREAGIEVERLAVEMELGSTSAVISAIESGAGISLVSAWAAKGPLAEGRIGVIDVPRIKARRDFSVVLRRGRALSAPAEAFFRFLMEKRPYLAKYSKSLTAGLR